MAKCKFVRFRLVETELFPVESPPKGIPLDWMGLKTLAVPVAKRHNEKLCVILVDPKRYKKNKKFREKVLAKIKRALQNVYKNEIQS